MKLYIIGQKSFGAAVLKLALEHPRFEVVGVSAPRADDVLALAACARGVPLITGPTRANAVPEADLALAAHCHAFVGADTRARMRQGVLAYHPSLLPRHRGRDAVRWAVHTGDPVTGGTLYWMTDQVDGGPIALQEHVFIRRDQSASELWREQLFPLGLSLFRQALLMLDAGMTLPRVDQDEEHATWEPAWSRPPLSNVVRLPAPPARSGHLLRTPR